jgi:ubiquinone/menaquinone biosynthesis C-methylase UbiE
VHTERYHRLLLAAVPPGSRRALDVGCGVGRFARKLAARVHAVDAIDRADDVVARARAVRPAAANIRFAVADFMTMAVDDGGYDFVAALASLHHLPLAAALERMQRLLRPGGVLGVIGLYREHGLFDLVHGAVALPVSRWQRLRQGAQRDRVPLRDPTLTLREIRLEAARVLPGADVRRRLLWRYTLLWTKR